MNTDNISDGYHTFGELYDQRSKLLAVIAHAYSSRCWKSKKHHDNEKYPMYDNMFIFGVNTPEGQATYHLDIDYWDLFDVEILDRAPIFDGHSPKEAIKRMTSLININYRSVSFTPNSINISNTNINN